MEKLSIANRRLQAARDDHERDYEAQIAKLADEERGIKERLAELNRKMYDPSHADLDVADDDLVEINAGGTIVSAKRSTLTQVKGTRFEALFSGRWAKILQRDSHGRIFLNVNPVGFRVIVDYLNEAAISSEENPAKPRCADGEHERILLYQLELFGLSEVVPTWETLGNIVKTKARVDQVRGWLKEDDLDGEFGLLYRSSRDGLTAVAFHSKCDNQGCTLTIIETSCGYVLGGYSNTPWMSNPGCYSAAKRAFLFVLSGNDIMAPIKMNLKNTNDGNAVYHCLSHGPIFGGGYDLYVHGSNSTVHLKFGRTYASGPSQLDNGVSYKALNIKEMEVFRVSGSSSLAAILTAKPKQSNQMNKVQPVTRFTQDVNEAINAKQHSLVQAESDLLRLEDSFKDEHNFIPAFAGGHAKDVVVLNVSGAIMATKRSTLQIVEDSVLAQQFDDSKWTEKVYSGPSVKDWKPDDVRRWVLSIDDVPDKVANIFLENKITGNELLALDREGLKMLDITRVGTLCLLLKEIKKLEKASKMPESSSADAVALIQHSPYCFGKILEYLRLKELHSQGLAEAPALPQVDQGQKSRFEKVVRYYFPGSSAKLLVE